VKSGEYPAGAPIDTLLRVFTYRGYPSGDKFDMFDNPRGAFTSDAININRNYVNEIDEDGRRVT
jgi:hypothetical protein